MEKSFVSKGEEAGAYEAGPEECGVSPGVRVVLALSLGALVLAVSDTYLNWVLFTDALVRRVLF